MSIESFFVELTGNADGLIRAAGEGEAAAGSLESRMGGVSNGMGGIGNAAREHVGGTAVKNVSLLDKAFGHVGSSIKGAIGGMLSMVGQTAGIGAIFGGAAGLAEGVKLAQQYNEQMALISQAYRRMGASVPTPQITAMQDAMTKLGFSEDASNAALLRLAQAHIPVTQQMTAMAAAADLARGKNMDLGSAMDLLLKAAQGTGRGLQDLGINLPATIPKTAALTAATTALAKAQEALHLAQEKYGADSPKTVAASEKVGAAMAKVNADTKAMADHFAGLPAVLGAVESRVGGAGKAFVAANPFATMGADMQTIARVAGEQLLPGLDNVAKWVSGHESQIESFATQAIGGLATAAGDAGKFIANDLYPPVKDVVGFLGDHKTLLEGVVGSLTALYAVGKVKAVGGSILDDLKALNTGKGYLLGLLSKITGLGLGSSGGGGIGGAAAGLKPVDVYVVNMAPGMGGGPGGGPPGGAVDDGTSLMGKLGIAGALAGPFIIAGAGLLANIQKMKDETAYYDGVYQQHLDQISRQAGLSAQGEAQLNKAIQDGQVNGKAQVAAWIKHWIATNESAGLIAADAKLMADSMATAALSAQQIAGDLSRLHASLPGTAGLTGGGRGFFSPGDNTVPPSGGGGPGNGTFTANINVAAGATADPQQTAIAIRDALLVAKRRGAINPIFGGR